QFILGVDAPYDSSAISPASSSSKGVAIGPHNGVRAPNPRLCFFARSTGYLYNALVVADIIHLVIFASDPRGPMQEALARLSSELESPQAFFHTYGARSHFNSVFLCKDFPSEVGLILDIDEQLAGLKQYCTILYDERAPDQDAHSSYKVSHARGAVIVVATQIALDPSGSNIKSRDPATADVSAAVALFSQHGCTFSIKGRGHSSVPGAANVDDGVFMNMRNTDDITLNQNQSNVVVGPGNSLGDVYRALDPYNVSAVLGRYDSVGFGLMVGAGLSFFNNRDGLAIDNVESYEVVIANGTVLHTSLSSHPDLHWALKGGNSNFGVVTHYTLRAFKNPGGVYGGLVTYPESSLDQINDVA
ncbi:MAG: hypothetical protein Q9204_008103, partial [Flavoplaca sp. TL-2023a]